MEAVLSYACRCGSRVLVCPEPADVASARGSDRWHETLKQVSAATGMQFLDAPANDSFVCSSCNTLHVRTSPPPHPRRVG